MGSYKVQNFFGKVRKINLPVRHNWYQGTTNIQFFTK